MEIQKVTNSSYYISKPKVGMIYKHYTGKLYKILSIARHSEDHESLFVVYQGLYTCPNFGKNPIWCRPYSMFTENIIIDGKAQPRFTEIINEFTEEFYHHGIKVLIKDGDNKILLLKRHDAYDLPGGRVQMNESYETAAQREVYEETGITNLYGIEYVSTIPSEIRIHLNQQQTCGLIYSFYVAQADNNLVQLSDEHTDYKWVPANELVGYLSSMINPRFNQAFDKIKNLHTNIKK